MATTHQRLCSDCRCPLVQLRDFDGTSSYHGEYIGGGDAESFRLWGLWAAVFLAFGALFHGAKRQRRRHKVEKLKAETLKIFPDSVICPRCLQVTSRV